MDRNIEIPFAISCRSDIGFEIKKCSANGNKGIFLNISDGAYPYIEEYAKQKIAKGERLDNYYGCMSNVSIGSGRNISLSNDNKYIIVEMCGLEQKTSDRPALCSSVAFIPIMDFLYNPDIINSKEIFKIEDSKNDLSSNDLKSLKECAAYYRKNIPLKDSIYSCGESKSKDQLMNILYQSGFLKGEDDYRIINFALMGTKFSIPLRDNIPDINREDSEIDLDYYKSLEQSSIEFFSADDSNEQNMTLLLSCLYQDDVSNAKLGYTSLNYTSTKNRKIDATSRSLFNDVFLIRYNNKQVENIFNNEIRQDSKFYKYNLDTVKGKEDIETLIERNFELIFSSSTYLNIVKYIVNKNIVDILPESKVKEQVAAFISQEGEAILKCVEQLQNIGNEISYFQEKYDINIEDIAQNYIADRNNNINNYLNNVIRYMKNNGIDFTSFMTQFRNENRAITINDELNSILNESNVKKI